MFASSTFHRHSLWETKMAMPRALTFSKTLLFAGVLGYLATCPVLAADSVSNQPNPDNSSSEPAPNRPSNAPSVQATPDAPSEQTASDAPHNVPELGLSPIQKQTIYQSVFNQGAKKSAEPVGFRAAVGAQVPKGIELADLPKSIVDLIPRMSDLSYAFVANQVLIVDPQSRIVLDVISQ
jgi:hypothetical protein